MGSFESSSREAATLAAHSTEVKLLDSFKAGAKNPNLNRTKI